MITHKTSIIIYSIELLPPLMTITVTESGVTAINISIPADKAIMTQVLFISGYIIES